MFKKILWGLWLVLVLGTQSAQAMQINTGTLQNENNTTFLETIQKKNIQAKDLAVFSPQTIRANLDATIDDLPLLFWAIAKKSNNIVKLLVKSGADMNQVIVMEDKRLYTPSLWAETKRRDQLAKELKTEQIQAKTPSDPVGPLLIMEIIRAIKNGYMQSALKLVDTCDEQEKKLLNLRFDGLTPLMWLARRKPWKDSENYLELMQKLIDKGADVNMTGSMDGTILGSMVDWNDYNSTKLLLDNKADPNACSYDINSPFIIALSSAQDKLVPLFFQNSIKPDLTINSKDGLSPLFVAIKVGCSPNIIRILLKHGANPYKKTALYTCDAFTWAKIVPDRQKIVNFFKEWKTEQKINEFDKKIQKKTQAEQNDKIEKTVLKYIESPAVLKLLCEKIDKKKRLFSELDPIPQAQTDTVKNRKLEAGS